MLEYYKAHPITAVLMIAAIIFAVIVFLKAGIANEKKSKANRELIEKLKKDNEIQNRYAILTSEMIGNAESEELFKGVGLNLQKRVAAVADMNSEFNSLTDGQKYIYALCTFCEDASEGMSSFFKMNSSPLTDAALDGAEIIIGGEFSAIFKEEYNAYNPNDEQTSCIPEKIAAADEKAAPFITNGTVGRLCGEYIKQNPEKFI